MREWGVEEIRALRERAIAGDGTEAIARDLRRTQADVRDMAALLGVSLSALAKHEWCDMCCQPRAWIDPDTGWCESCTARIRIEAQRIKDDEEEQRLREEADRADVQLRKERQRMREQYDANPRKRARAETE